MPIGSVLMFSKLSPYLSWKNDVEVQSLIKCLEKEDNLDYEALHGIKKRALRSFCIIAITTILTLICVWVKDGGEVIYFFATFFGLLLVAGYIDDQLRTARKILLINAGVIVEGVMRLTRRERDKYFNGYKYWYEFKDASGATISGFTAVPLRMKKEHCYYHRVKVLYLEKNPKLNTLVFPEIIKIHNIMKVQKA